jgi:Ca2+-binding RTX toxin-like protein
MHDTLDLIIEARGPELDTLLVETALAVALPFGVELLRLGEAGRIGIGNAGANQMTGNAYANRLEGREGNDVLEGRGGNDTLVGGAGADIFVLRRGDGFDRIEDFVPGEDRLLLSGHGLTVEALLARGTATNAGVTFDLGGGDGFALAGLSLGALSPADFILAG